jgi:hypothetical protein
MANSFTDLSTKEDLIKLQNSFIEKLDYYFTSTASNRKWLRSKDVENMLSVSSSSLQNMRNNGLIPFSKVQGTIFYEYKDIVELLEKNKVGNTSST